MIRLDAYSLAEMHGRDTKRNSTSTAHPSFIFPMLVSAPGHGTENTRFQ